MKSCKMELAFCVTGIGSIATTYQLQKVITHSRPDLVIQLGIAGAFSDSITVGSAVAVKHEIVAEMGVFEENGFKDIFELGLENKDTIPYKNGLLTNEHENILYSSLLKFSNAITVNEITTSTQKINLYRNHYKADIETMEGAAMHFVCIMNEIPFIQIRGISNHIGERDKKQWKIKQSMDAAVVGSINVIKSLEK